MQVAGRAYRLVSLFAARQNSLLARVSSGLCTLMVACLSLTVAYLHLRFEPEPFRMFVQDSCSTFEESKAQLDNSSCLTRTVRSQGLQMQQSGILGDPPIVPFLQHELVA